MEETSGATGGKSAYHHGDLRNALIDAASGLARSGGPEAVVLRAAARRVGVSPAAAYRHFAGQAELLQAVKERGQQQLAEAMERMVRKVPGDDGDAAEARARALGLAYVRFALEESGLFRTAFCRTAVDVRLDSSFQPDLIVGESGYRTYELLVQSLDALVTTGRMPPERRLSAEITAWGMVHGLAMLILDGPLSALPADQRDAAIERAIATVVAGLTAS